MDAEQSVIERVREAKAIRRTLDEPTQWGQWPVLRPLREEQRGPLYAETLYQGGPVE